MPLTALHQERNKVVLLAVKEMLKHPLSVEELRKQVNQVKNSSKDKEHT